MPQNSDKMRYDRNWEDDYRKRMISPEEAAKMVKSGDRVYIPLHGPRIVHLEIAKRAGDLRDVEIHLARPAIAQVIDFTSQPGWEKAFKIENEIFIGAENRWATDERKSIFNPVVFSLQFKPYDEMRPEARPVDVLIVNVAPPNKNGFCNFGHELWHKKSCVQRAKLVIAEVDDSMITAHGNNWVHVSEIDYFVDAPVKLLSKEEIAGLVSRVRSEWQGEMARLLPQLDPLLLARSQESIIEFPPTTLAGFYGLLEPAETTQKIAGYVSELIRDGDCIQCGVGEPSASLARLGIFDDKNDLGFQSELTAPGFPQLVARGIITGKHKNIYKGKAVATSWTGASREDREIIDDNPLFELHDAERVVNVTTFAQIDNQVAINNAISVDLLGQINSESAFGPRMINGNGGQPECHLGAVMSKGGRALILLPSSRLDGAISTIVPMFEPGTTVTIPRHWADMIITEYGVARLMGKNHRQRAEALIEIAHPDFRAELRESAKELFGR
jgi:4-hydroxybutyrate CoA-transferase